ncbi:MAG: hypothetical protein CM15mP45_07530 [Deltaproteobacteria bacterium]|nr:MAG: hypothetical protein CM15mP45_07530 [Deltaproteobacteria bacterium]
MISRYLASEYSRFFMLFLGAFVIMIFIGNVFGNLSIIFEDWEGFLRFLRKTALIMPQLMEFTIPITVLLATITTLSTLNRTSELLAIRASGVGPWNLAWPLLLVTLVIAAVTYLGQNYLSVWMQRQWTETASTENLQPIWKVGPDNKLYFFGKLPEKGKLESVTLFQWQTEPYRIVERTAIEKGEQQKTSWNFQDLQQYRFSENHLKLQNLDELNLKIEEVPSLKFEKAVSPRNLPLFELRKKSKIFKRRAGCHQPSCCTFSEISLPRSTFCHGFPRTFPFLIPQQKRHGCRIHGTKLSAGHPFLDPESDPACFRRRRRNPSAACQLGQHWAFRSHRLVAAFSLPGLMLCFGFAFQLLNKK